MIMHIYMPLTYVLIATYFTIKNKGFNKKTIFPVLFYSFLANFVELLSLDNLNLDNITYRGILLYLYSTTLTSMIMLIVLFLYYCIKKGKK